MNMPTSADLVDRIIARLPKSETVTIPDVSVAAFDLHRNVIKGWIECGEVDALDFGGGGKEQWHISRASLEHFLRRRAVGLRVSAERSLSNRQLDLFKT